MFNDLVLKTRQVVPRVAALSVPATLALAPSAFAQTVAGAVDPATGLSNMAPYFLTLASGAMICIAAYKGGHAFAEGRSYGGTIVGFLMGMGITWGGYYMLSKWGISTSA